MKTKRMALEALKEAIGILGFGLVYDACESAIAALEADLAQPVEPVALAWLPIEIAPKDGSFFLATDGTALKVLNQPPRHYMGVWDWNAQRKQWRGSADSTIDPTHWMPLPAAPGAAS